MRPVATFLFTVVLLAGCAERTPLDPLSGGPALRGAGVAQGVTVFNQNLYIGADVDAVITALASPDPTDDLPALVHAINTLVATDFPSRAGALADAIARERPAVIALQEVSTIDITLPPLGVDLHLNFLDILQAQLTARGLGYTVAAKVTNTVATPAPGIQTIDEDAVLVDHAQVTVTGTLAQNYSNNVGPVAPGVTLIRGFALAQGTVDGTAWTFVSTHLEPDLGGVDLRLLRAAQAAELLAVIGAAPRVVLMGDFNDVAGSPMYQTVAGGGYTDAWAALRPGVTGLTCCHVADLSNAFPTFDKRIDYVFTRGVGHPQAGLQGRIDLLGDLPPDRLAGPQFPIWPADHAGVFAHLLAAPAGGIAD